MHRLIDYLRSSFSSEGIKGRNRSGCDCISESTDAFIGGAKTLLHVGEEDPSSRRDGWIPAGKNTAARRTVARLTDSKLRIQRPSFSAKRQTERFRKNTADGGQRLRGVPRIIGSSLSSRAANRVFSPILPPIFSSFLCIRSSIPLLWEDYFPILKNFDLQFELSFCSVSYCPLLLVKEDVLLHAMGLRLRWASLEWRKDRRFQALKSFSNRGSKLSDFVDELGQWKNSEEMTSLPEEIKQKINDMIPPNESLGPDTPLWNHEVNGIFTIKSAYQSICKINREPRSIWKLIWKANTIPRNKTILWRLGHEKLPTRSRLASWCNINPMCPLCGSFRETNIHLLRDCRKVAAIWNLFINPRCRALFYLLPTKEWISWNLQRKVNFSGIQWSVIFPIGCSLIWKWRNRICNDSEFTLPEEPHRVILFHARTFVQACSDVLKTPRADPIQQKNHWVKPCIDWIKVNCDGAVCNLSKKASCGGLLRDSYGNWISGYMANLGTTNVLTAELWGIYYGIKTAWAQGYRKVVVESDSTMAVKQIIGSSACDISVHPVTYSIRKWLNKCWVVQVNYISRSGNMCADLLAKKGLAIQKGLLLLKDPPEFIRNAIHLGTHLNSILVKEDLRELISWQEARRGDRQASILASWSNTVLASVSSITLSYPNPNATSIPLLIASASSTVGLLTMSILSVNAATQIPSLSRMIPPITPPPSDNVPASVFSLTIPSFGFSHLKCLPNTSFHSFQDFESWTSSHTAVTLHQN
ncbi:ribonuclease H [Senna tora]|uniref:Ribonuclease H n=1 Tax=Senna tora TaxID=362788 RepID=A0A834T360_9FABA|nr:ribonuclease H [Senna tora]